MHLPSPAWYARYEVSSVSSVPHPSLTSLALCCTHSKLTSFPGNLPPPSVSIYSVKTGPPEPSSLFSARKDGISYYPLGSTDPPPVHHMIPAPSSHFRTSPCSGGPGATFHRENPEVCAGAPLVPPTGDVSAAVTTLWSLGAQFKTSCGDTTRKMGPPCPGGSGRPGVRRKGPARGGGPTGRAGVGAWAGDSGSRPCRRPCSPPTERDWRAGRGGLVLRSANHDSAFAEAASVRGRILSPLGTSTGSGVFFIKKVVFLDDMLGSWKLCSY